MYVYIYTYIFFTRPQQCAKMLKSQHAWHNGATHVYIANRQIHGLQLHYTSESCTIMYLDSKFFNGPIPPHTLPPWSSPRTLPATQHCIWQTTHASRPFSLRLLRCCCFILPVARSGSSVNCHRDRVCRNLMAFQSHSFDAFRHEDKSVTCQDCCRLVSLFVDSCHLGSVNMRIQFGRYVPDISPLCNNAAM